MLDKVMVLLQVTDKSLLWNCQIYDRCETDRSRSLATSQLNGIQTFARSCFHYRHFKIYLKSNSSHKRINVLFKTNQLMLHGADTASYCEKNKKTPSGSKSLENKFNLNFI
jgi:hypothetical protein